MNKKTTVGQLVYDNLVSSGDQGPVSVVELEHAMQADYLKNLLDRIDKDHDRYSGDFYVVVLTKKEKILDSTFRNYFFTRNSCPTPFFDQSVFKYNKKAGRVEYLWTLPDKKVCAHFAQHHADVPAEEQMLLGFVMNYYNGTLLKLAQKLNNETQEQGILYIKETKE